MPETRWQRELKDIAWANAQVWTATQWAWTFFLSGAGVTLYLKETSTAVGDGVLLLLVVATVAYLLAAVCNGLLVLMVQHLARRVQDDPDQKPEPWDRYSGITPAVRLLELGLLATVTVALTWAVVQAAVQYGGDAVNTDSTLAHLIDAYGQAGEASEVSATRAGVLSFCQRHGSTDETTRVFIEACAALNADSAPSLSDLAKLSGRLRHH